MELVPAGSAIRWEALGELSCLSEGQICPGSDWEGGALACAPPPPQGGRLLETCGTGDIITTSPLPSRAPLVLPSPGSVGVGCFSGRGQLFGDFLRRPAGLESKGLGGQEGDCVGWGRDRKLSPLLLFQCFRPFLGAGLDPWTPPSPLPPHPTQCHWK